MKRKHSYTGDEKRSGTRVFRALQGPAHSVNAPHPPPYVLASIAAHGASRRTLYRWRGQNLSEDKIKERLSHRGRLRKFSDEENMLMVGYVIDRRMNFLSVSRDHVIAFTKDYLGVMPRPQYISELLSKHDLTYQTSKARNSRLTSEDVVKDAIDVILKIRDYAFTPDCIIVFDETGLWSNVVQPHTYHFKNWCARVEILLSWLFWFLMVMVTAPSLTSLLPCSVRVSNSLFNILWIDCVF
jgi:hypothetical protein